jgi:cell wall-associated NlpC family hydrolase
LALTLGVVTVGAVPAAATIGAPAAVTTADAITAPKAYRPFAIGTTGVPATSTTRIATSSQPVSPVAFVTTTAPPGSAAAKAIEFGLAQRGLPYVWGGDGPQKGEAGFDCSGLTTAAYAYAGITLPRTAHTQFYAGPHVPDGAELQPGDLVFYGVPARVHHVGLYIGGGRMVNAPTFGKPVQLAYVRYKGDDYLGATRPAAGTGATGLIPTDRLPVTVPPTPSPSAPQGPGDFPAPPAPDPAPNSISGGATPQQLQDAAEGPADQQATVGTTPDPTPPVTTPAVTTPLVTAPPITTPTDTTPTDTIPPVTAPPVTTTPPATTPPATTPPGTTPPDTTPPVTTTPTTPPVATPPVTTPPATKPPVTTPPAPPAAKAPTGLVLPSGTLTLARAATDANGLPTAPASASRGSLGWHPGTGGAWTAAVTLSSAVATGSLTAGATVVVTGPGGARTTLAVASVRTVDAATAKTLSRTIGKGPRVVLLRTDAATGRVLVITAT